MPDLDLATRRKNSPITQARMVAFSILGRHAKCFADDVVLDDFLEDMAQAILKGITADLKGTQDD